MTQVSVSKCTRCGFRVIQSLHCSNCGEALHVRTPETTPMTDGELIARLTVAPGDFVTLNAQEAAQVVAAMRRRTPITVDIEMPPSTYLVEGSAPTVRGFDMDAR